NERAVDERVARAHLVALVDAQVLALRHGVLGLLDDLALRPERLDDDRALAALLLAELDEAVDLGDDRGILGLARLEELRDARQTAGDVLRAADLARRLREHVASLDALAVLDLDVRALGDRVEREGLAVRVLEDELRVQVALVLDDQLADTTA